MSKTDDPFSQIKKLNVRGLPAVRGGAVKVHSGRGIRVNYGWYWTDEFKDPEVTGSSVRVRYDYWDPGRVYAKIKRQWDCCYAKDPERFNKRSVDEVRREARQARIKPEVAVRLTQFLEAIEAEERYFVKGTKNE